MKKTSPVTIVFLILLVLLVVLGGLYLPALLLETHADSKIGELHDVSIENYIGKNSSISTMASLQLTEYERIRLISNSWDGDVTRESSEFSTADAFSMVQLTKEKLHEYYKASLYPISFKTEASDNWYSYEAQRFCSTDTTFKTFSAYYWLITLTKYDSTEKHTVLITENGTILYATVNTSLLSPENRKSVVDIQNKYKSLSIVSSGPSSIVKLPDDTPIPSYREVAFPDEKTSVGVVVIGDDKITGEGVLKYSYSVHSGSGSNSFEYYYVFQTRDFNLFSSQYTIGIIPYENAD